VILRLSRHQKSIPRVPGFESHFTGSPILTVKARTFDFSDSFKLFHDVDNKSESQGWFLSVFFFLTSSQVFGFSVSNEFGVIYCRCYAECLLWFCGGFFFSKGEFLEPLSPSRWFLILYDTIVTGVSQYWHTNKNLLPIGWIVGIKYRLFLFPNR